MPLMKFWQPPYIPAGLYGSKTEWEQAVKQSKVRLQWDPDRHPIGAKLERRAIQLGLRGDVLSRYARDWIIDIEDISEFVQQQHRYKAGDRTSLLTPNESVYPVTQPHIAKKLELSSIEPEAGSHCLKN